LLGWGRGGKKGLASVSRERIDCMGSPPQISRSPRARDMYLERKTTHRRIQSRDLFSILRERESRSSMKSRGSHFSEVDFSWNRGKKFCGRGRSAYLAWVSKIGYLLGRGEEKRKGGCGRKGSPSGISCHQVHVLARKNRRRSEARDRRNLRGKDQ